MMHGTKWTRAKIALLSSNAWALLMRSVYFLRRCCRFTGGNFLPGGASDWFDLPGVRVSLYFLFVVSSPLDFFYG